MAQDRKNGGADASENGDANGDENQQQAENPDDEQMEPQNGHDAHGTPNVPTHTVALMAFSKPKPLGGSRNEDFEIWLKRQSMSMKLNKTAGKN